MYKLKIRQHAMLWPWRLYRGNNLIAISKFDYSTKSNARRLGSRLYKIL